MSIKSSSIQVITLSIIDPMAEGMFKQSNLIVTYLLINRYLTTIFTNQNNLYKTGIENARNYKRTVIKIPFLLTYVGNIK